MDEIELKRRAFLRMGIAGAGFFATVGMPQLNAAQAGAPFYSLKNLGQLHPPDQNGVMLPRGFRSRIVARSSQQAVASSSYVWHNLPDGGACYGTDDGGWIYVSNSEESFNQGGVGALRFSANGAVVDSYSICSGTNRNCAGGATPWGTWLTCEEFDRGQVYECDPFGQREAVLRPALGTFQHEAVTIDLANDCAYLTEDTPDGGFYRYVSERGLPDLDNGRLEIAAVVERQGQQFIDWIQVPDPDASIVPTRSQVPSYHPFNGGEGMARHDGVVYFTTKGDNRVWAYRTDNQQLDVIYDAATSNNPILTGVDNVVITPAGDVLVAEDGGNMQIVAITPDLEPIPVLQIIGQDESEICGPAFDPSHQRLYFSSQKGETGNGRDGITYEISRV